MAGEWRKVALSDIADLSGGFAFKSKDYAPSGRFILRTLNIRDDCSISRDDAVYLPEELCPQYARFELKSHDTLFVMVGATLGKIGYVREKDLPVLLNQNMWLVRAKQDMADSRFVHYAFRQAVKASLGWASGSARDFVRRDDYRNLQLSVPPLREQRVIGYILGTLDDQIELNQRMNETLEAMARAIFKSWFVDFDPVRAKAEGRQPFGMDAATAALFPDSFRDSPLGKIPEGWKNAILGDFLTTLETGSRPQGGITDIREGVPSVGAESIVGIGRFDFAKTKLVPREFFVQMKRGHVSDGDVLLYKDGGRPGEYEPHVTMVGDGFPFREFCINEHVYRVRTAPALPQLYLYFWLTSDSSTDEMRNRGTGVAVPGLNSTAVRELTLLVPSGQVATRFDYEVTPLVKRILSNCNESCTLAAIRDALLPKLISGEIRLRDAGKLAAQSP